MLRGAPGDAGAARDPLCCSCGKAVLTDQSDCGFDEARPGALSLQHLAAGSGGCRVPDLPKYMGSLAHNRAILIRRHLRWFQTPIAYLRLLLLFISYAAHYHTLRVFPPGIAGFLRGVQAAKRPPVCSRYTDEAHA